MTLNQFCANICTISFQGTMKMKSYTILKKPSKITTKRRAIKKSTIATIATTAKTTRVKSNNNNKETKNCL